MNLRLTVVCSLVAFACALVVGCSGRSATTAAEQRINRDVMEIVAKLVRTDNPRSKGFLLSGRAHSPGGQYYPKNTYRDMSERTCLSARSG